MLYKYTAGGCPVHVLVDCSNQDFRQLGLYCVLIFGRSGNCSWVIECIVDHVLEHSMGSSKYFNFIDSKKKSAHPFAPLLQFVIHLLE